MNRYDIFLLKSECPITRGISGRTHGEATDKTPAENENKYPTSIVTILQKV